MSVLLQRGANTSLTQAAPALSAVLLGLAWDARPPVAAARAPATRGPSGWTATAPAAAGPVEPDVDAAAILLGANGRVLSDRHFVFFNNLESPDGAVEHSGESLMGAGDGDDAQIAVDLTRLDRRVERVAVVLSLYDATSRGHTFDLVHNCYVRVVDKALARELARFDLPEEPQPQTAMIMGELYRHGPEWKFRAVGQGYAQGLRGIATDFGVDVTD